MRISRPLLRFCFALQLLLLLLALPAFSQDKKGDCGKPPKLVYQPTLSKEDVTRIKSSSLTGRVRVVIDEDGSVAVEKVLAASSKEAGQILFDAVVLARFKPRPGCGPLKAEFVFTLTK